MLLLLKVVSRRCDRTWRGGQASADDEVTGSSSFMEYSLCQGEERHEGDMHEHTPKAFAFSLPARPMSSAPFPHLRYPVPPPSTPPAPPASQSAPVVPHSIPRPPLQTAAVAHATYPENYISGSAASSVRSPRPAVFHPVSR